LAFWTTSWWRLFRRDDRDGRLFLRRESNTEAFFLGGRSVPWWAVGLSIFGTSISSITYLAIPAKAYATDWIFLVGNMMILLIAPLITWFYIPAFRRAPITTAYEYLETRFNLCIRIYGSIVFLLFQAGRIAIVLYLPALVLSAATGLSVEFSILTMGLITTLYTVIGGVEAVIWTDVVQSFVLVGGALLSLAIAIAHIDGGFTGLATMAAAEGKTHWFEFSTDYTTPAIWVCVIGNIFAMLYPSTADQTIVQRYLTTATEKAAARAVWTNALLTIPVSFLFFGLGTALWGYFKTHPEQLDPTMPTDAILPVFVMETFPVGLRSTLIAGVFAAAMSSLSASMNSLSAVAINDYYKRFVPGVSEARALRAAKAVTLLTGVFGTGMALIIAWMNVPSLFDQWLKWLGLIGGGLAGIVALGVFTKRAHGRGAVAGALASAGAVAWVQSTPAHFFLHGMTGFLSAYIVGYAASLVLPRKR
jgi:SSS family solute:Na+ symporter